MIKSTPALRRRHMSRGSMILASTMLTGMAVMPAIAHADQAPPAAPDTTAPAPAADSSGITEIVVTATHKSESLQKVPISIQALDASKLTENHVASFTDYAQMLPSLSFQTLGPGRSQPFFRGISVNGGRASTVGTYLDDIPITSPNANPEVHIYDVQRVEALSGPQGTLFGASSLAGTIRIITNKPEFDKIDAGMDLEVNKFGDGNAGGTAEGFINLPVTHDIAIRLMGFYEHTGGYINNTPGTISLESVPITVNNAALVQKAYNPDTEYGGRAELAWRIAPDWTITPSVTYQHLDAKGSYNYDPRVGDLAVHDYSPSELKDHWYQAELSIQGKIGDFDIVSATGFFSRTYSQSNDYTYYSVTYDRQVAYAQAHGGGFPGLYYTNFKDKNGNYINPIQQYEGHEHDKTFTQEVRLSTPKQWPFALTVGGFYQYQRQSYDDNYYIPGLSSALNSGVPATYNADGSIASPAIPPFSPALSGVLNNDSYYLVEDDAHSKDGAAFAEGNVNVTSKLKLIGGIRYFISDNGTRGFDGTWSTADAAGCWNEDPTVLYNKFIHPSRLSCINTNTTYHQTGQTHKLAATWQFEPSKMLYATYSTGFRPGGGNRQAAAPAYKADTLTNFEAGWKMTFGRNFRWNGAVYYEKWKGVQYTVVVPDSEGSTATINAGNARVYGIESDFEYHPFSGMTLSANGAYNNAELSSNFCDPISISNLTPQATCSAADGNLAAAKGTRLPRQPIFKGNVSARYEFTTNNLKDFVQLQAFHQSGSTSDLSVSNDELLGDTSGFTTFNMSAGTAFGKFTIEAFLENAFDNRGILSKNTFCSIQLCAGSSRSYPIKPQFFGLKLGYKY